MTGPTAIYSAAQVRALDAYEIQERGTPAYTLMTRAAQAALAALRERWPGTMRLIVICGGGNNGGDGYVLARLAQAAGLQTRVFAASAVDRLAGEALQAHRDWQAAGGVTRPFDAAALRATANDSDEVLVDGLLGTGFSGAPRPETLAVIEAINASGRPVLSLDIPSGLNADDGQVQGAAVRADLTVCFVAYKAGLFLGEGPAQVGDLRLATLGVVPPAQPRFRPQFHRLDEAELAQRLPARRREVHKGSHGRVLVIGGGPGMPGAPRLSGEAALRVGAGLVTVAGAPENLLPVLATRPELIYLPAASGADLQEALAQATVIALGPGLGRSAWARSLWEAVMANPHKPVVLDADALNLLAESPRPLPANWILTPHPGEAARLLGCATEAVQADRPAAARALQRRFGAISVLKGAGTWVALPAPGGDEAELHLCDHGNPGMATAGMGDVLTGVIAGLRAQLNDSADAARLGVLVHALAGDAAARAGQRGLLASDVIDQLRGQVNP